MSETNGWYDRLYADDPSTDNVFGREDFVPRTLPGLAAFLAQGGRLGAHVPLSTPEGAARLAALLDRLTRKPP